MEMKVLRIVKAFSFLFFTITYISAFSDFCSPLANSDANSRNAEWYPPSCNTDEQMRGSRCFLKCKEGYKMKAGARMSTDCVNIGRSTWGPIGIGNTCEINRFCPPLISPRYSQCNKPNITPGYNCHPPNCQGSQDTIGPVEVTCLENGTWSTGGSYCKEKISTSIDCPKSLISLETDPNSAYVDARVHIPNPDLTGINPGQVKAPKLENLNNSVHELRFMFDADPSGNKKSCNIDVTVTDKQKPVPFDCVEEEERAARPGLTALINPSPCLFRDGVDGELKGVLKGHGGSGPNGNDYNVGVHNKQRFYEAKDSSDNMQRSFPFYTVHERHCRFRVAPIGVKMEPLKGSQITLYKCAGGSLNTSYAAFSSPFRSAIDPSQLYFTMTCLPTFLFNGIPTDCYEPLPIANGACSNGSVPDVDSNFCIPCPRGFYFAIDKFGAACKLCPVNYTTEAQGSSVCTPCPENSRTIDGLRYCEYFCQLGEAYNGSSCEKCTFGTYGIPGATNCTKCPANTMTIKERASSETDCVPGKRVTLSNGTESVRTTKRIPSYIVFGLNIPVNQLHQNVGLLLGSRYLSLIADDCTDGYAQVIGQFDEFQTNLTVLLCGAALKDKMYVVKLRPWRTTYIKIYSKKVNTDFKVTFGHGVCSMGQYFSLTDGQCRNCSQGTYQDHQNSYTCKQCENGMTNFADGQSACVKPCPAGSGGNGILCVPCPMNTYGINSTCLPCANGNATEFMGSKQCSTTCKAGEFKNNQGTCDKCPHGMYQPNQRHSQKVCFYCPQDLTTIINGATSQSDCLAKEKCHYEGEFYNTTTEKCEKCPLNTYKIASGGNVGACTKCIDGLVTKKIGSIRKSDCQVNQTACEINNPCHFPGQCIEVNGNSTCLCPKYYTGEFCKQVDGPCRDANCNNGTCVPYTENSSPFSCICKPGYTGNLCDSEHDPCDPNPCFNGNCTVSTPGKYNCSCPMYWGGKSCTKRLDTPCENASNCNPQGGRCVLDKSVYGKFTCTCHRSYEGPACHKKIIPCEKNPCNVTGTEKCENKPTLDRHCICKPGFGGDKCDQIKACTAGEFHYEKRCCSCIQGSYHQENTLVTSCTKCPPGLSTYLRGSKDPEDCTDLTKKEYFQASVFITSTIFQGEEGKINKSGCGYLDEGFELKLPEAMSKILKKSTDLLGVQIESFHPPPPGKTGLVANFTVYGNIETNEKAYRSVLASGNIGGYLVEETYIEIYERHEGNPDGGGGGGGGDKKKTPLWLLIVLPVVAALLIIIFVAYKMHKRNQRTTPVSSSLFNKEYGVSFAYAQEARVDPDGLDKESYSKTKGGY